MALRHVLILSSALLVPLPSFAQDADVQLAEPVENGKQPIEAVINANAVYMHSGAGQNYYQTGKLSKGDKVVVVGAKFDWLKITPPEGSFSYVAQAFVERVGDGKRGRVTRPDLNVRCGSSLNESKAIVQTKLAQGAEVQIIGEKDEYFMIKPPEGAYLYVNKQFVDPIAPIAVAPKAETPVESTPQSPDAGSPEQTPPAEDVAVTETPGINGEVAPTTQPGVSDAVAVAPSTQPSAELEFERLETAFEDADAKSIEEQPISELKAGYEALTKDSALPESLRRVADYRIKLLTVRENTKEEMASLRKSQEASAQRRMALQAEQEELAEQMKKNQVKMFAAVGTLNTSSLQQATGTLYRLCDPATGRTVVYIRTDDPTTYAAMLGQFIGVKGDLSTDPQLSLKVIEPTEAEPVEQANLYKSVAAQVVPPSLVPRLDAQASIEEQPAE